MKRALNMPASKEYCTAENLPPLDRLTTHQTISVPLTNIPSRPLHSTVTKDCTHDKERYLVCVFTLRSGDEVTKPVSMPSLKIT